MGQVRKSSFSLRTLTDGESLGDFAFRKALPQLHCYDRDGIGFWVDAVGYSSALAYGVLIPLGLVPGMFQMFGIIFPPAFLLIFPRVHRVEARWTLG